MDIEVIPCLADNYAYLIVGDGGHAVVIDPSEATPVRAALARRDVTPVAIWATHHHHDHVGGIPQLLQDFPNLEVLGSVYDAERQRIPGQTRALNAGDPLWFQSGRVRLLFVPGHTLGAVAFVYEGALFSGDTLFGAGCGRHVRRHRSVDAETHWPACANCPRTRACIADTNTPPRTSSLRCTSSLKTPPSRERLARVQAQRVQGLPSVPCTLAEERATNPFLRWDEPAIVAKALAFGAQSAAADDVFAAIRRAKDSY